MDIGSVRVVMNEHPVLVFVTVRPNYVCAGRMVVLVM